jgi:hypothetical protein
VLYRDPEILVSHAGDTRVYLVRQGQLQQLTVDHNLENYMKEHPNFRPKMKVSGKTLIRALGLKGEPPKLDHMHLALQRGDVVLISTDGLTDSLPIPTLTALLGKLEVEDIDGVTTALVRSALNHGSMDNISLIVLQATDRLSDGPRTAIFDTGQLSGSGQLVLGWLAFLDEPHQGRLVPLEASTVIGADPSCRVVLTEDFVSGRHLEVLKTSHGYEIRDLGSTNGTYVNNVRLTATQSLVDGDRVRVGRTEMIFKSYAYVL